MNLFLEILLAAFTMVMGMAVPFFGSLLGFFGGFALAPTTYYVSRTMSSIR